MCEIPKQNPLEQSLYTSEMKDNLEKHVLSRGGYQWKEEG
jgi:hypothetical protein